MKQVNVSCPKCNHPQNFSYQQVHGPDDFGKVMNKEIFQFYCEHCQHQQIILYPMVYVDESIGLMVALFPKNEPLDDDFLKKKIHPYVIREDMKTKRKVLDENELTEKLLIAYSDMDDYLVEMVKVESIRFLNQQEPDLEVIKMFLNRHEDEFYLTCFLAREKVITLELDLEVFNIAHRKYHKLLSKQHQGGLELVNQQWANDFLKVHLSQVH